MDIDNLVKNGTDFNAAKAQAHLTLLRFFCAILDAAEAGPTDTLKNVLNAAEDRYILYLELLLSYQHTPKESLPLPPWDVALILHAHLLSPFHFKTDFSKPQYSSLANNLDLQLFRCASRLQNLHFGDEHSFRAWSSMYPSEPFQIFEVYQDIYRGINPFFARLIHMSQHHAPVSTKQHGFGLNLAEAVVRQWDFSKKITNVYPQDPVPRDLLHYVNRRYIKFMILMREQRNMIVPTLDIDLFWHTHQLSSHNYDAWCVQHIGRPINHDDTIEALHLSNGLENTKQLWVQTYGEEYLSSPPQFSSLHPKDNPQIFHPPQGLSPIQLELWAFDLDRQKRYDEYAYKLLQLAEQQAVAIGTLEDELRAAKQNLHAAGLAFDQAYHADVVARATAMGRPGTHPDMPLGWERKGLLRKLMSAQKHVLPILGDKLRKREEAIARERFVVEDLESRIRLIKDPYNRCIGGMEYHRGEWRKQRWEILKRTGGVGTPAREEDAFLGFKRTIPAIQPVFFPLYAAGWYGSHQVGPYNYSFALSENVKVGKSAGGFMCGTYSNYGISPYQSSGGSSCGSGG